MSSLSRVLIAPKCYRYLRHIYYRSFTLSCCYKSIIWTTKLIGYLQNLWGEEDVKPGGKADFREERLKWMAQTSGLEFGAVSGNFDKKVHYKL